MSDCSSLAPGATLGGKVRIGLRSAISIGAVIKDGITIGEDCVVGASSYVNANLPGNCVAYGTPAKIVRSRSRADRYL
jgi:acetyltransferase-like isoleucine patch superfamily enzyme